MIRYFPNTMEPDKNLTLSDSLIITKRFRNPNEFSLHIEEQVLENNIGYIDAIIQYCENADIDVESAAVLINMQLKEKIQNEAEEQNYMRTKRGKLPL